MFVTFQFCFKVPLKNIKKVIPEEDVFEVIHKYHNIMNNHSCSKTTYHQVSKATVVGLYGAFERKKGRANQKFNTLKNTKITISQKAPFFNVTKK